MILRPNDQRAKNAIIMLWIILALEIISIISSYFQYELLQKALVNGGISDSEAEANDTREQIIGIVYLVLYIGSGITFIQWFRRAYFNMHLLSKNLSFSEGWAAGAWFVPFVNLYRPLQIMKELYTEARQILKNKASIVLEKFNTNYLGIWWAFWIICSILSQINFRYARRAETIDDLINVTIISILENILSVPLALLAIKTVKDYSQIENLLYKIDITENKQDDEDIEEM